MKALSTEQAIELVDSEKEISFEFIEKNMVIMLQGDSDVLDGEALVTFIINFLQYSMQFDNNLEHAVEYKYALDHRLLRGFTLNVIISECRAITFNKQP